MRTLRKRIRERIETYIIAFRTARTAWGMCTHRQLMFFDGNDETVTAVRALLRVQGYGYAELWHVNDVQDQARDLDVVLTHKDCMNILADMQDTHWQELMDHGWSCLERTIQRYLSQEQEVADG